MLNNHRHNAQAINHNMLNNIILKMLKQSTIRMFNIKETINVFSIKETIKAQSRTSRSHCSTSPITSTMNIYYMFLCVLLYIIFMRVSYSLSETSLQSN